MLKRRLLVGTRGSRLALAQANLVVEQIRGIEKGVDVVVVPVKTLGDTLKPGEREGVDGKTAFTGELERSLVEGSVDLAVHSMKDLPAEIDERLVIAATPLRGDARDALVSANGASLGSLGRGATLGTSSLRRRAQLLKLRSDIKVVELHGNIETRLGKVREGGLDGAVLAAAGLRRLGFESRVSQVFGTDEMIPAVCQGTLAVESRSDDRSTLDLLARLNDPTTRASSDCERAFSAALGGDCSVPLGAFAEMRSGALHVVGMVADPSGREMAKASASGSARDAKALGERLARKVSEAGGRRILQELTA